MANIISMLKFNLISRYEASKRLMDVYENTDSIATFLMCSNKITTSQYSEIMEMALELKNKYIKKI